MRKSRIAGVVLGAAAAVALVAGPASAGTGPSTSGVGSVLGGNQVLIPVSASVNVCGNAVSVLGVAAAAGTMCNAQSANVL